MFYGCCLQYYVAKESPRMIGSCIDEKAMKSVDKKQ